MALLPGLLHALEGDIITRAIPSTGEEIPIVGLGSLRLSEALHRAMMYSALPDVLNTLSLCTTVHS